MKLEVLVFLDHSAGLRDLIPCALVGWVTKEDREKLIIDVWRVLSDEQDLRDNNAEVFTVGKSMLLKRIPLKNVEKELKRIAKTRFLKSD